ncbi:MAG: aspartate kinase [Flavobacteriaceae bacterium]|tara:strand:+ start:1765 stop:3015 length:1251 start_codon:yes stop_codon:yes gene_type:complete
MKVFKFGGASIKDASSIKNILEIISNYSNDNLLIVVSAMGKTTNALEKVVENYFKNKSELKSSILEVLNFHIDICNELFPKNHLIFSDINSIFQKINTFINSNKSPSYSFVYDQLVSNGELISSKIIYNYMTFKNIESSFIDARDCIKTDSNFRGGNVKWDLTNKKIKQMFNDSNTNITQGFIASDKNNFNVTLGREGSDYSAAIFAYALNAESLSIWKDVPGLLNADPKFFSNTKLLKHISYSETIELAFYGASIIHPKTLQPLQKKEIPLNVKSFKNPESNGTKISKGIDIDPLVPCYIFKDNLILLKLSSLDFSFMVEQNISKIFKELHDSKMKVDVIQNSAISFSVCFFDKYGNLNDLISRLEGKFKIEINKNVSLFTIRHFDEKSIKKISYKRKLLLEQRTEKTIRLIFSN